MAKKERTIREPHGETKYIKGPDGPLSYRITSGRLTRQSPERAGLWARIEADVLARNEVSPVDMYAWGSCTREDGSTYEDVVRVRFAEDWSVAAIEEVP